MLCRVSDRNEDGPLAAECQDLERSSLSSSLRYCRTNCTRQQLCRDHQCLRGLQHCHLCLQGLTPTSDFLHKPVSSMGKCQDLPGLLRHPPCLRDSSKGGAIEAWQALRSLRLPWHLRAHQRLLSVFSTLARNRAREVPRGIAGAPTLHLLQYLFAFLRLPSELLHFGKGPGKRESRGIAASPDPFPLRASSTRELRSPLK